MHPPDEPRICRECPVPHIENCVDCFGFGVWMGRPMESGGNLPVNASDAEKIRYSMRRGITIAVLECPTCGSTAEGLLSP